MEQSAIGRLATKFFKRPTKAKIAKVRRGHTQDGWPDGTDPFKPGQRVVMGDGRCYQVDRRGGWRRDRTAEVAMKQLQERESANAG